MPTPTPLPLQQVDVVSLSFIGVQGAEVVAASVAVGFLFLLVSLPSNNQLKVQNAFLIVEILCFPIWFVSLGWWVLLQWVLVLLYVILNSFSRLVRR